MTLTCDLDFLSGDIVGVIEIVVRVKTTGTLVNTASVTAPQTDLDPTNNTASVTVNAPPPPVLVAPKLTTTRPAMPLLRASRSGTLATVSTRIRVDRKATVTLTVRNPRTGRRLKLQAGSRLASTILKAGPQPLRSTVGAAGTFSLTAMLPTRQLTHGATYQLVITASSGKTSTLTISFTG